MAGHADEDDGMFADADEEVQQQQLLAPKPSVVRVKDKSDFGDALQLATDGPLAWPTLQETVARQPKVELTPPLARIHRPVPESHETRQEELDPDGGDDRVTGGRGEGPTCTADVVVVDTAGFIHNCPLDAMGATVVTVREVVAELRDRATRERLAGVLPYTLTFREPSTEAMHAGTI